ncbi:MAG: hypothetical protein HY056_12150, partial [Proteobacteria bacterium]|nr:hypothetical protein [Pseudomonadota bacterium]
MNGARFVLPLVAAALFAALAVYALPRAVAAGDILLARDDADVVARAVVEQTFSAPLAEREVDAALASEDVDLARSLQALAQARGIALAPEQAARID